MRPTAAELDVLIETAPPLGLGIGPDGTYTRAGRAAAFILGTLTMFVFLPCAVAGALLYTHAEERFPDDPDTARKFVNWSWIAITTPLLVIPPIAAVVVALL